MFKTWLKLNDKVNLSMETYNTKDEAYEAAQTIHNNSHKPVYVVELKVVAGIGVTNLGEQSGSSQVTD